MILKKKDEKKERETNRGNEKKRLICYRLQKKLEAERPLFFNEDTLQSVERPTGTSSTKN